MRQGRILLQKHLCDQIAEVARRAFRGRGVLLQELRCSARPEHDQQARR